MKKLFAFLIKYSIVILFLFLEVIAFSMVVRNNGYQQSVFFSSSNTLLASLYSVSNSVIEYFYLQSTNEGLATENTELKNKVIELQNQLEALRPDTANSNLLKISPDKEIHYIQAKAINNSTNKMLNYITLNKGKRDGIRPDMGVVSEDGVVGVVSNVSEKFAVVIPVINPKIQINSKFLRNNYSGPIHWNGQNYRFVSLNDIARHVVFSLGDTIVTSGYSKSFPEGIFVGTVDDFKISESDAYYHIKVRLGVNFRTLTHVKVIDYLNFGEQQNLEKTMEE